MTEINFDDTEFYEQVVKSLKKIFGEDMVDVTVPQPANELEPVFLAQNIEALANVGYYWSDQQGPTY